MKNIKPGPHPRRLRWIKKRINRNHEVFVAWLTDGAVVTMHDDGTYVKRTKDTVTAGQWR